MSDTQQDGFGGISAGRCPPEIIHRPVPADLAEMVLSMTGYRERESGLVRQVETASLVVPLIIGLGEPFEIALGKEPGRDERYGSFTAGLCARPALINSYGGAHCVQVNFTPLGAFRFFGLPMSEIAERMVVVDDLDDRDLGRLRQQLGELEDWPARLDLLGNFVRERLARGPSPSGLSHWAYGRIVATGGRVNVAGLSQESGFSRKHLAVKFRNELGLPPKAVARIARFERARRLAGSGQSPGWADIAAASGYADQAHLVREFREFAGLTPTQWRAAAA